MRKSFLFLILFCLFSASWGQVTTFEDLVARQSEMGGEILTLEGSVHYFFKDIAVYAGEENPGDSWYKQAVWLDFAREVEFVFENGESWLIDSEQLGTSLFPTEGALRVVGRYSSDLKGPEDRYLGTLEKVSIIYLPGKPDPNIKKSGQKVKRKHIQG